MASLPSCHDHLRRVRTLAASRRRCPIETQKPPSGGLFSSLVTGASAAIQDPLRALDERDGPLEFRARHPQRGSLKLRVFENALCGYAVRAEIRYRVVSAPHVLDDQCCNLCPPLHDTVHSPFNGTRHLVPSEPKQSAE